MALMGQANFHRFQSRILVHVYLYKGCATLYIGVSQDLVPYQFLICWVQVTAQFNSP